MCPLTASEGVSPRGKLYNKAMRDDVFARSSCQSGPY